MTTMKCKTCRKADVHLTISDKINRFFIRTLFPRVLVDMTADSFTQGFSEGYKEGFDRSDELARKEINNIIKLYHD
jgi:hypothetical protein